MDKLPRWIFVIGCLFLTAGCVSSLVPKDNLFFYQGKFSELETLMEGRVKDPSAASTADLFYLCSSYWKLKKYDKLFSCTDEMERHIARGDRNYFFSDVSPFLYVFRADAYIGSRKL